MLREGYWITAYATMPFIALGVVMAILGVRRVRGFIKYLNEQDQLHVEQEQISQDLDKTMRVLDSYDRQDPSKTERPAE